MTSRPQLETKKSGDRRRIIPIRFEPQLPLLECGDKLSATHERNRAEDAKAAINESPWDRNAADMTRDESKRNHSSAGNQTKRDDPFVAYRIAVWADEQNSEHKVGKGQPVRPICEEWILCICCGESMVHASDPRQQMGGFSDSSYGRGLSVGVSFPRTSVRGGTTLMSTQRHAQPSASLPSRHPPSSRSSVYTA
jgi:hypothetical protein